jgi:hypothetical protein
MLCSFSNNNNNNNNNNKEAYKLWRERNPAKRPNIEAKAFLTRKTTS